MFYFGVLMTAVQCCKSCARKNIPAFTKFGIFGPFLISRLGGVTNIKMEKKANKRNKKKWKGGTISHLFWAVSLFIPSRKTAALNPQVSPLIVLRLWSKIKFTQGSFELYFYLEKKKKCLFQGNNCSNSQLWIIRGVVIYYLIYVYYKKKNL